MDRLTNDSDPWLNAVREEEMSNYADAVMLYLTDAAKSLDAGMLTRAGLSASCAADCLTVMGARHLAKELYYKSATIYKENADDKLGGSVREWLWSLQKTRENLLLAGELEQADLVHRQYVLLARKIDLAARDIEPTPRNEPVTDSSSRAADPPSRVVVALNSFLEKPVVGPGDEASGRGRKPAESVRR